MYSQDRIHPLKQQINLYNITVSIVLAAYRPIFVFFVWITEDQYTWQFFDKLPCFECVMIVMI